MTDSKLTCPTCGHECKYGYIDPVKRDEVLDEAVDASNSVLSARAYGTPDDPPKRMRELINKAIEALKEAE